MALYVLLSALTCLNIWLWLSSDSVFNHLLAVLNCLVAPVFIRRAWQGWRFRRCNQQLIQLRHTVIVHLKRLPPDTDMTVPNEKLVLWYETIPMHRFGSTMWDVTILTPLSETTPWSPYTENPPYNEWVESFRLYPGVELCVHHKDVHNIQLPPKRRDRKQDRAWQRLGLGYADADDLRRLIGWLEVAQPLPPE